MGRRGIGRRELDIAGELAAREDRHHFEDVLEAVESRTHCGMRDSDNAQFPRARATLARTGS